MDSELRYLIVRPEKGGFVELFRYAFLGRDFHRFVDDDLVSSSFDYNWSWRWVILVSILVRKFISFFAIPIYWTGFFLDFFLNLLSLNGASFFALLNSFIHGRVVIPDRGSQSFVSTIGHLDARLDLQTTNGDEAFQVQPQMGNRALMDLCIMSSKIAYENPKLIKNVVNHHWNMHFVDFYDCWNDFEKQMSTQVFILCDKLKDANFVLVSFRGTEPFDAHDWSTDFDYSWYQIPNVGKIHIGFLEALGLGNRNQPTTFYSNLQRKANSTNAANLGPNNSSKTNSGTLFSGTDSDEDQPFVPEKTPAEKTAYDIVRSKLRSLLEEHKDAKFIVTGHSLGGALAILFPTVLVVHEEMEIMDRLLGVYTFGQPRIGNRQLGRFMEPHLDRPVPKYFRVVYCNDIVPRLPYDDKTFLYKHFGQCLYYNSHYIEKNVKEEPNRNFFGMRFILSQHLNAVWELVRGLTMGYVEGAEYKEGWFRILVRIIGLALPGFSAHCPTDYVNSIRLGKESSIHMSSI